MEGMMKRKWILLLALSFAVISTKLVIVLSAAGHQINKTAYEILQLKLGQLTEREAETILGAPPGDYRRIGDRGAPISECFSVVANHVIDDRFVPPGCWNRRWIADGVLIQITFGRSGHMIACSMRPNLPVTDATLIARLYRELLTRLGL
jgi:hypothetical protein